MLRKAKEKSKNLVMADLHHLPFRNGCIDGITNVNVLYQLDDPEMFIREAHRILRPRGKIVVSTPKKGKSAISFIPAVLKSIVKHPRLLIDIKKILKYNWINKKISM
jgi:ubiquinone/menaquinone biosynthesis C-methylase UbiE